MTTEILIGGSLIDLENDELRPVGDICKKKTGKRPSPQCIWRWRKSGVRGCKLEAVFLQGTWQTSEAAFAAFIRGQTANFAGAYAPGTQELATRDEATTRRLEAAGLL